MKGFWILHLLGALLFSALLGLYSFPEERLPPKWAAPRSRACEELTSLLAPWTASEGAVPSQENVDLMRQMIQEKYEESMSRLEQQRDRLQKQLDQQEKPQ